MHYIIFAIDTNIDEFIFILEYTTGDNRMALGEIIKLNSFCYIKGFELDFFEMTENPYLVLDTEGIYIYKYNSFTDMLNRLDIKLTPEEIKDLKIKNKLVHDTLVKKSNQEIMSIIHGKNHDLFKNLFEEKKKKKKMGFF